MAVVLKVRGRRKTLSNRGAKSASLATALAGHGRSHTPPKTPPSDPRSCPLEAPINRKPPKQCPAANAGSQCLAATIPDSSPSFGVRRRGSLAVGRGVGCRQRVNGMRCGTRSWLKGDPIPGRKHAVNAKESTVGKGWGMDCGAGEGFFSVGNSRGSSSRALVKAVLEGSDGSVLKRDSREHKTRSGRMCLVSKHAQVPGVERTTGRQMRSKKLDRDPIASETACSKDMCGVVPAKRQADDGSPKGGADVVDTKVECENTMVVSAAASDTNDDRAVVRRPLHRGHQADQCRKLQIKQSAGPCGYPILEKMEDGSAVRHRLYCWREQLLIDLEMKGEIEPCYVQNDGKEQHLIWYGHGEA